MKLETFFEKFDLFAAVPGAVTKMRALVLHLAVHGNLVAQNPEDEPASVLLERSRAVMSKLMAAGQAKQEKPASPTTDAEATFALPPQWTWCRLVDAGQFINGLAFKPSDWGHVGRPIIRIQNLSGRNLEFNRTAGTYDSSVLVQNDDVLVSWSATLDAFIWRGEEGVLNQHIFRVLPSPLIDKAFLYWLLKWVIRQLAESDHAHGLVMSHINRGPFLAHPIPLPPLAEQKRIVAKVNELMELCDRLEVQQQERETRHTALAHAALTRFAETSTPANLQFLFHESCAIFPADLRRSILILAVQGKIVPQDLDDEPITSTFPALKSLQPEASDGFDIPTNWMLYNYRSLTTLVTSGSRGWKEFYAPKGAIFVRTQNIKTDKLVLEDVAFVDLPNSAEGMRAQVLKDDILITITGANVTKAARVEKQIPEAYVSQHIALTRPRWSETSEWLHLCFISHGSARGTLERLAYGDKPGLNLNNIRDLTIPIPPLAEQKRIVARVDQLMSLVDKLEADLTAALAQGVALLDALVEELTSQS